MCLHSTEEHKQVEPVDCGYQVRVKTIGGAFAHLHMYGLPSKVSEGEPEAGRVDKNLRVGVWYDALDCNICPDFGPAYESGFHVWHHKKDAIAVRNIFGRHNKNVEFVVVRVEVRKQVIAGPNYVAWKGGRDTYGLCTVAKQMKILREED